METAMTLYYSCVYSLLSYCFAASGDVLICTEGDEPLKKLQINIVRSLFE